MNRSGKPDYLVEIFSSVVSARGARADFDHKSATAWPAAWRSSPRMSSLTVPLPLPRRPASEGERAERGDGAGDLILPLHPAVSR